MYEKKRVIHPYVVIAIAFFSSFKNASVYLLGNRTDWLVRIDYLLLITVSCCLLWVVLISNKSLNLKMDKKIFYFIPLLIWVVSQSTILTVFTDGNYIPRNLITSFMTMLVILLCINNSYDFKRVVWAFGIGAGLSALIPLILFPDMIGSRSGIVYGVYYRGSFWNYALISFVSVSWILIALTRNMSTKTSKIISYFIFGVTWLASFAGLSRSLLLITLISVFVYLLFLKRIRTLIKVSALIILVFIIIINFLPNTIEHFEERISFGENTIQDEARIPIWTTYLDNISEYYLVGAIGDYREYGPSTSGPHSTFLNWLVQYGVLGLFGFLYLIFGLLKEIKKAKKGSRDEAACLFAWLACYLSLAFINQTGFTETSIFVAFGLILSWTKLHNEI